MNIHHSKRFFMITMVVLLIITIFVLPRLPSVILLQGLKYCSYKYQYFSDTDDDILLNRVVEIDESDFEILKKMLVCPILIFPEHDFGWTDEHSLLLMDGQNQIIAQVQIAYPWGCGFMRWKGRISGKWFYVRVNPDIIKEVLTKYRYGRVLIAG